MKGKILVFSRFFRQKAQKDSFLLKTKKITAGTGQKTQYERQFFYLES